MSSAEVAATRSTSFTLLERIPGALWLGIGVYVLLLIDGSALLNDPDTCWHIAVGQWILDHGALPWVDIYSFTKVGEPWISTSWLAQVAFAKTYDWAGWAGPVLLAALASAASFALLAVFLTRRIGQGYALFVAVGALTLTAPHLLARPHVLVLPVMLAFGQGLLSASAARRAPSLLLLPLLTLWANLHGSFVFGLALIAAVAVDALCNAQSGTRGSLAIRWLLFAAAALVASWATPYGFQSVVAARRILDQGELLQLIDEWRGADFSRVTALEIVLLAALGAALYCRVTLPLSRILLLLGLLHMALAHVRNIELLAMLGPLIVVPPLAAQFRLQPAGAARHEFRTTLMVALSSVVAISSLAVALGRYAPPGIASDRAVLEVLEAHHARRILNDMAFAGVMISQGVPVFIDGRAELYGEPFALTYHRALELNDVDGFFGLLQSHGIDAVWLTPATPAARLLGRVAGWHLTYSDDRAVVYVRNGN